MGRSDTGLRKGLFVCAFLHFLFLHMDGIIQHIGNYPDNMIRCVNWTLPFKYMAFLCAYFRPRKNALPYTCAFSNFLLSGWIGKGRGLFYTLRPCEDQMIYNAGRYITYAIDLQGFYY